MARTRAPDYEDKRARILEEAARLFAVQGFPRTSIEALARACGGSKAWIYHYYPSKEALLFHLLKGHVEDLAATAEAAAATEGPPAARLRALIRALMRRYVRSAEHHVVLLNDLGVLPEDQQREIIELQRRVTRQVAKLATELNPAVDGPLRAPVTMALMGAINFTYAWFDPDGPVDADTFADLTTNLFLSGIGAIQPTP